MITQETEEKLAEQCGLKVVKDKKTGITKYYEGSPEQAQELSRLCGILEEQFENESKIIRENQ